MKSLTAKSNIQTPWRKMKIMIFPSAMLSWFYAVFPLFFSIYLVGAYLALY